MIARIPFVAAVLVAGSVVAMHVHPGNVTAQAVVADGATVTATAQLSTTPTVSSTPGQSTVTMPTSTPTGRKTSGPARATPTFTHVPVKPLVRNPTPIRGIRRHITLPKPVMLIVGSKTVGTGLSESNALQTANKDLPQIYVKSPTHLPKNFMLQLIQITPAQDQQTPASVSLQYVPKGLTSAGGSYPSFYVTKQLGPAPIVLPGARLQTVTINKGIKGVGVVKGTVVDLKLKNGYEIVHVTWQRVGISYDVSSTVGISKLSIKDLLAVAATVQ